MTPAWLKSTTQLLLIGTIIVLTVYNVAVILVSSHGAILSAIQGTNRFG